MAPRRPSWPAAGLLAGRPVAEGFRPRASRVRACPSRRVREESRVREVPTMAWHMRMHVRAVVCGLLYFA